MLGGQDIYVIDCSIVIFGIAKEGNFGKTCIMRSVNMETIKQPPERGDA